MRKNPGLWLCLLMFMLMPSLVWANTLTIEDVDLPEAGSAAKNADVSVYFDLRAGEQAITGITADNCSVLIDGNAPEVKSAEIIPFKDGTRGVGVLFIFPIAKNYDEESFGIRESISNLLKLFNRDIDLLNLIPYDNSATSTGWKKASEGATSKALSEITTESDVLEPNLFTSFSPAIAMLKNLEGVSKKYVVIISDAEGAIVGQPERANQMIGTFTDQLKQNHITPIVIGYSPDGAAAMTNIPLLKRIASNGNGQYFQAERRDAFQQVMTNDVYNYIYGRYIYHAVLDMNNPYLEEKKYNLQLVVKTKTSEDKAAYQIAWPALKKDLLWLWLTIGASVIIIGGVVFFIVARRRDDEEEPEIEEGPQEVCCATCGKVLPKQLYGFNGEFCLSGGLPDCPYYQMPDRGKIQITRGVLADTTFFIKKDMTTIGSYPENDIYLDDKSVSRKHAAIKTDEGKRYEMRDFGSSNGTYVNNEKIDRKFLRDGDILRFGTVETVFKLK